MTGFVFPQPGERTNASAVPVPHDVLRDLVMGIVNGDANSRCPGCPVCDRWRAAAWAAMDLLSPAVQSRVQDYAQQLGVNMYSWPEPE